MKGKRVKKTSPKKHFSLKEEYKTCFEFIKDSRNFIYIAILIFLIFTVLGFFFEDLINILVKSIFKIDLQNKILDYIGNLLAKTEGMDYKQLMGFIFLNNLQSSFFGMILGIIFGIFPLVALTLNGYVLGFVAMLSVKAEGFLVLWRILPHGIFELPAIFISLGFGLRLGSFIFIKKQNNSFSEIFLGCFRVFLLVVLPLLIIAAIIESSLIALAG